MSQVSKLFALLTVTFMIASMAFIMPASAEHTWTEEVIDHAESVGFSSSIGIDSSNNPVIAYGSSFGLNYTTKSGSSWTKEHVSDEIVQSIDMELDSSGNPHVAIVTGSYYMTGIMYASKSGGTWTNSTVINNTRMYGYISIELDASNNPYILCTRTDSGYYTNTLALFYQTGGSWVQENITTDTSNGGSGLAISNGNIHVVYGGTFVSGGTYYATRPVSGGTWQIEKITDDSVTDGAVSMETDSSGTPHLLLGFKHFWKNGNQWSSEPLDMIYSGMDYLDFYINSNDNLYAAFHVNYNLIYGQKIGSSWEFEAVRTGNDGWGCSVIADNTGMPHITHYSANYDNLTYHAGTSIPSTGDTDNDGLPDNWEINNFGNLDQDATDDPDGDGHDNQNEYANDTDPLDANDPALPSTDTDSDGLPDSWEQTNFGNLNQGATDDPDSDGHDNLDEYNSGTDPNDSSDPGIDPNDTDGDGLPDTWEQDNFGNLNQDAGDDPDSDLFDNYDEYIAGSDPNDADSTPLDLGLDILNSILLWAIIAIIVIVLFVILIIYLFIKAVHDDDVPISQHYAAPPPPPVYQQPPPMYCPNCGSQSRFIPGSGNWCDTCGKYL